MLDLAVLTPVVLLLLMLLLERFEHWLGESTPAPPARPERRRWRRPPRAARSLGAAQVGAGRRLLAHRPRAGASRRPAAAASDASVPAPRAGRRHVLGGRVRSRR